MSYTITIKPTVVKELKSLPKGAVRAISAAIENLAEEPRPAGCRKLVGKPFWRVRVGNYRIIYSVDDVVQIVDIRAAGHRKDIYD